MFIVFEGVDGCGKTTVMKEVVKRLENCLGPDRIVTTREPGGTPLAEKIREMMLHGGEGFAEPMEPITQALLASAARHQHVMHFIRPALEEGKVVFCDRFYASTYAYQGSQLPEDKLSRISLMTTSAVDGTRPDITFLLEVDADVALSRKINRGDTMDDMEKRTADRHVRMTEIYRRCKRIFYDEMPQHLRHKVGEWRAVDANRPLHEVVDTVVHLLLSSAAWQKMTTK